jgi:hypothetical protein
MEKILVAGWFSFENCHATAGDLLTRDVACEWIVRAGFKYEVALAHPFTGGVDIWSVNPTEYSHLIFVCGPFHQRALEESVLSRFAQCRLIGLNLSMSMDLDQWNPFDFLIERDSSRKVNPDLAFASRQSLVPVAGLCLVEDYPGGQTQRANAAIERLRAARQIACVQIDTRLDVNSTGLRSPAEVESMLARVDVVITTRLHGMVLALKNGVPALSIDPEAGGAKVLRQAQLLGWPVVFTLEQLTDAALQQALDYCLTADARERAKECARRAFGEVQTIEQEFLSFLQERAFLDEKVRTRLEAPPKKEIGPLVAQVPQSSTLLSRFARLFRKRRANRQRLIGP